MKGQARKLHRSFEYFSSLPIMPPSTVAIFARHHLLELAHEILLLRADVLARGVLLVGLLFSLVVVVLGVPWLFSLLLLGISGALVFFL